MGHTRYFLGGEIEATLRAAIRIVPGQTLHVGAGGAMASFGGGGSDIGKNDNVVRFESLAGVVGDVAVVWDSFAMAVRVGYLRGDHTTYIPAMLLFAWYSGGP
jgi:hypothetical protein